MVQNWGEMLYSGAMVIFALLVGGMLLNMFSSIQCTQYISQIDQLKSDVAGGQAQVKQCSSELNNCSNEYQRLITENITKKDIEDLKYNYQTIYQQNILLNQKFENISNRFITAYNTLNTYYSISLVVNIAFVFGIVIYFTAEILSLAIFKTDIRMAILQFMWEHTPESVKKHVRKAREKVKGNAPN